MAVSFSFAPADALLRFHALMLLSALVARFFLRSAIPAYSCFPFALMPLYGLLWYILTRSTVCPAVLLLHHVQGVRFCHLFPCSCWCAPICPTLWCFYRLLQLTFSCGRLFLHIPALRSIWCHCMPYSGIFWHAAASAPAPADASCLNYVLSFALILHFSALVAYFPTEYIFVRIYPLTRVLDTHFKHNNQYPITLYSLPHANYSKYRFQVYQSHSSADWLR